MEEKKITDELEEEECCEHEHHHHHHDDDECCGHEHHHHHHHDDDDECCEHGHHHHHHDDDDDECCGHDHHHHHHHDDDDDECCEHDHEHDHEHHHHHDHGHKYEVPGFKVFETHNHEGATICSFEKDVKSDAEPVIKNMKECIGILEKWLDENNALIGHVKGYVKEAGPITTFSTVGYGLNVEKHDSTTVCVGFASIVFGPSEEELKDKVAEIFAAI